jgi:hypothetical protein
VHFSLELLLAAITKTLINVGSMSISQVISTWSSTSSASEPLSAHWHSPARVAASLVSPGQFTGSLLKPDDYGGDPQVQALRAFQIIVTQARDSQLFGRSSNKRMSSSSPAARTIEILENGEGTLSDVLLAICDECVAQRHIANTMRKMGNQQDCSLRFYPDGPVLVPTGIDIAPSYSGSRLQNTMRILADIKMLNLGTNGPDAADVAA